MSLLVRRHDAAALLLVGDLTYNIDAFDHGVSGGVGSKRQLQRTGARVRGLRSTHQGMAILAAHDHAAAGLLDAATAA